MNEATTQTQERPAPAAPENAPARMPRVDIREDAEQFILVADLPGADEKSVEATVQNRVLTIEGWAQSAEPAGQEPLGREFAGGRYRRDFTLSDAVDPDRIRARVKHGVLTVVIPKKDEVKARKISIAG